VADGKIGNAIQERGGPRGWTVRADIATIPANPSGWRTADRDAGAPFWRSTVSMSFDSSKVVEHKRHLSVTEQINRHEAGKGRIQPRELSCGEARIYPAVEIQRVLCRKCGQVKQERLHWLADYPFHTWRFAFFVGRRCRVSTIQDVAKEVRLDWKTVKELDKQYMREQLRRT
jgi:hypothetical protein